MPAHTPGISSYRETPVLSVRVFDTCEISAAKLVLTLLIFGPNKRWHFSSDESYSLPNTAKRDPKTQPRKLSSDDSDEQNDTDAQSQTDAWVRRIDVLFPVPR